VLPDFDIIDQGRFPDAKANFLFGGMGDAFAREAADL
jgi:hypothetical protein